jgi:hypothetical protein
MVSKSKVVVILTAAALMAGSSAFAHPAAVATHNPQKRVVVQQRPLYDEVGMSASSNSTIREYSPAFTGGGSTGYNENLRNY